MTAHQFSYTGGRSLVWQTRVVRIAFAFVGLGLWFLTQGFIGTRPPLDDRQNFAGVLLSKHDAIFQLTEPLNRALHENRRAADALLIASSAVIDLSGLALLVIGILGRSIRPFVALLILFALRQICQATCALPPPDGIIWRSPDFPTLLVTYGVGNDFFFSGHTAIAVLGLTELARRKNRSWTALGIAIVIFEATTVLVLRAHIYARRIHWNHNGITGGHCCNPRRPRL